MITRKLRSLLEEYQARRWFPQQYPDPFGELIDWITEERIREFQSEQERTKKSELLDVAAYLVRLIPAVRHPDSFKEFKKALSQSLLNKDVHPDSTFYYLRSLPEQQANLLWQSLRKWAIQWHSILKDWISKEISVERSFEKLGNLHWDRTAEVVMIQSDLKSSRELFDWERKQYTKAKSLPEILQFLNLSRWNSLADWRDLPSFARNVIETCKIRRKPKLRKSEWNRAIQYAVPIRPPKLVRVDFGEAVGPIDVMRFLFELGQSFFYAGMDPDLEIESRICGDPALPLFWGFTFSELMVDRSGLSKLIGHQAEDLDGTMEFASKFRRRYDAALALFRDRVDSQLKDAKDLYVDSFETAFSFEAPHFLYLFDLNRASDALHRAVAQRKAIIATERFRELYGREWFTSERFARRIQEYWWQGFHLTLHDILRDLL